MAPQNLSSSSSSSYSSSVLDALLCEEEQWDELEDESPSLSPIFKLDWENEELISLFSKEQQVDVNVVQCLDSSFYLSRKEAVEWMLVVKSYYGFSTLTAILSVNYFDRFLHKSPHLHQQNKPWMIQLAAVTCLSLAAKVEETDVPLLLDLQVGGAKYMFEAKTIQKMELLILSTLEWKMNPVTPISFVDHIIRRLGLKNRLHSEFLRRCEQLFLSIIPDSRFVAYLPSVLATATMMHVIEQIEPSNTLEHQNQLLSILNITKDKVKNCYDMIKLSNKPRNAVGMKRERDLNESPSSPKGVIDTYYFNSDASSGSCALTGGGSSTSPSVSSSPDQRALKKKRVDEKCMQLGPLGDAVGIAMMSIMSYLAVSVMRHFVIEELQVFFLIFPLYLWKRY